MFFNNKQFYKGVTFMELLVVIAIIGIMGSVGLVSLQSSKLDARLKAAQGELVASIRLAQSYALQGKTQDGAAPCGYGFRFASQTDYSIFYRTPDAGGCNPASPRHNAESFVLKDGVQIDPADVNQEIYFTVPFGNISGPGIGDFVLTHPNADNKTVTVNNVGNVVEN
ncbi:MAG: prepilin-type N-terminal cleavage/methylation domain-containing protein [Candidatus Moranbacteria bacterium]|nr:prepilin-type N-terminal cleavage/methylation domain-containing protein [Candidatus Moranbacteria bacterium]